MRVLLFCHKASPEQLILAEKWMAALGSPESKLYNIPNHRPEDLIKDKDTIVTFGKFAELAVRNCIADKKLKNAKQVCLPHPRQLLPTRANAELRAAAQKTLEELQRELTEEVYLPEILEITAKDLPELKKNEVLMLEKIVQSEGKESCYYINRDGKLIQIGTSVLSGSKADIHLSFRELFTLSKVLEVLGKDVEVRIERSKASNTQPTTDALKKVV